MPRVCEALRAVISLHGLEEALEAPHRPGDMLVFLAHPDQRLGCRGINVSHDPDLGVSLRDVLLVDAERVSPDQTGRPGCFRCQLGQRAVETAPDPGCETRAADLCLRQGITPCVRKGFERRCLIEGHGDMVHGQL